MFNPAIVIPLLSTCFLISLLFLSYMVDITLKKPFIDTVSVKLAGLSPYLRRLVYSVCIIWGNLLFYMAAFLHPDSTAVPFLIRSFGLTSLTLLYLTLSPGLVKVFFPGFSCNSFFLLSRRALGRSAFVFALIHAILAFYNYYGGSFSSFFYLSDTNKWAIAFGAVSLIILTVLGVTSLVRVADILKFRRWKFIHRFIYPAVILVLLHSVMRGSDFLSPASILKFVVIFISLTYVLLEVTATYMTLTNNPENSVLKKGFLYTTLILVTFLSYFLAAKKLDETYHDLQMARQMNMPVNMNMKMDTAGQINNPE